MNKLYYVCIGCTVITLLLLLYATITFFIEIYKLRKFRGPLAFPLIGNCYNLEAMKLLSYLSKLRKRYGRVFTFFSLSNKAFLVVCDPVAVRRILSDSKTFIKGTDYTQIFAIAFGEGLVTSNGDKHKHDRGIFGKYFIKSSISKNMEIMNTHTLEMINSDELVINKDYNIEHFFAILSLRLFSNIYIGKDYRGNSKRENDLANAVSKGSWAVGRMITLALPTIALINPYVKKIQEAREVFWDDMKVVIEARKIAMKSGDNQTPDDCITAMINENLNDKEMLDHLATLISAGHDTTAYFCSYMCYLLAEHQKEQDILREEINQVLGNRTLVNENDVTEMKYLSKVMQETLRLYSIIPMLTRLSNEEVHIKESGVTIPKNVNLLIPMFLINRDPELWDNPSQFNPDRFDGKVESFTSAKNGFFPFGYGTRTCIGNTLSILESGVMISQLIRKFRIKSSPGFKLCIQSGISLTTDNGVHVILSPI
jgi:cytochrome P450